MDPSTGVDALSEQIRRQSEPADAYEQDCPPKFSLSYNAVLSACKADWGALFDAMPGPIVLFDADGLMQYVNIDARHRVGLEFGDLIGKRIEDVLPAATVQRGLDALAAALSNGLIQSCEVEAPLPEGGCACMDVRVLPLDDGFGKIGGALAIVQDKTSLVRAKRALRQQTSFMRKLATSAPVALAAVTVPEYRHVFSNAAYRTMLGISDNELAGYCIHNRVDPRLRHEFLRLLDQALQTRAPVCVSEYRGAEACDGVCWNLHLIPLSDESGVIDAVFVIAQDISAELRARRAFEALVDETAEGRERTQAVLQTVPCGVIIVQAPDGHLVFINERGAEIYGRRLIPGITLREHLAQLGMWSPEGARLTVDELPSSRALNGETVDAERIILERPDGSHVTVSVNARPMRDSLGNIVGAVAAFEDITDLQDTEAQLRAATEHLERRVEERSAEAEYRTAQLRTLAVELTRVEQSERKRLAQMLHDHLQQMLVSAKFSVGILKVKLKRDRALMEVARQLENILDDSIEESRTLTYDLSPPILYQSGLVPALEWLRREMLERHGLNVRLTAHNVPEKINEGVCAFMFSAVRELLFNSCKYSGVDKAFVTVRHSKGVLEVLVADEGVGFDPENLRTDDLTSHGFGLFSIRERIGLLGGSMEIDSGPGEGSRFILHIPLKGMVQQTLEPRRDQLIRAGAGRKDGVPPDNTGAEPRGKTRILLVDDHRVMRQGLATLIMEERDLEVVGQASNGREALEIARTVRPDVVVMDASMPEMDGIEATRAIKAEMPATRIIGLSMFEEADMAGQFVQAGAEAYINKGGPPEELLTVVRGQTWQRLFDLR